MDGDFGVEGIRYFSNFRAANSWAKKMADTKYTYNITNGVYNNLRNAGYSNRFYFAGTSAWELDLRSSHLKGLDKYYADDVDLFFISTHGNHKDDGTILLAYDSKKDKWLADSKEWRLRDRDIEWMAVYGCKTINKNDFRNKGWSFYQNIFHRLHLFLGAYDYMWDGWTTEEVGRDFADNLIDGDTVKAAWMDGVSDWWVDNHPAVISAEKKSTLKNGKPDWPNTTMQKDKYHGRGGAQSDIDRSKLHWLGLMWEEG